MSEVAPPPIQLARQLLVHFDALWLRALHQVQPGAQGLPVLVNLNRSTRNIGAGPAS